MKLQYFLSDYHIIDYLFSRARKYQIVMALLYFIFYFIPFVLATGTDYFTDIKGLLISCLVFQSILILTELIQVAQSGIGRLWEKKRTFHSLFFIGYFVTMAVKYDYKKDEEDPI